MSQFVLGSTIRNLWTVLDANNDPVTGVTTPAGVVFTLHRDNGSAMVAASEVVSWAEIGTTGHYYISFTPENLGLYVLQLEEIHVSSILRTFRFADVEIVAAGAVFSASYNNAFCGEADIERWLQVTITGSTRPDSTAAAGFAEARAAVLMSLCARFGHAVTPSTVVSGSRLEDLLREANAIGAGLDYTVAQQFAIRPSTSDRVSALEALWEQYTRGPGLLEKYTRVEPGFLYQEIRGNLASLSTDHIISGDTLAYTESTAPTAQPIGIGMGNLF